VPHKPQVPEVTVETEVLPRTLRNSEISIHLRGVALLSIWIAEEGSTLRDCGSCELSKDSYLKNKF
jgi:hypothetical protein